MARIVMVDLYNPAAAGARYVAAALRDAGHDVWFIHFKEFRYKEIPSADIDESDIVKARLVYVRVRRPGKWLYLPYPTEITEKENSLFIEQVRKLKPDLLAFSTYTVTAYVAEELTDLLKKEIPEIPVLWGGLHTILDPEGSIQKADIICTGEGEEPAIELLNRWDEYLENNALDTSGLWFRKDGEIIRNEKRPPTANLDDLPFPHYGGQEMMIEDDRVIENITYTGDDLITKIVFTERGCPYRCSYCIHSILHTDKAFSKVRRRSVENVLEECDELYDRFDVRHYIFHDEIFVIQKEWIREFSEKFRERFRTRGCSFTGYVHPATTRPEMLEWLWQAGLTVTGMGVQTGSKRVMTEIYDRPWMPERVIEMSHLLAKYPFEKVQFDLLTANPYETEEDRRATFDLLLQFSPPFDVETFDLVLYPTSKLGQRTDLEKREPDINELTFYNMLYFLAGIPEIDRDALRRLADNRYYRENALEFEQFAKGVIDLFDEKKRLSNECHRLAGTGSYQIPWRRTWKDHVRDLGKRLLSM